MGLGSAMLAWPLILCAQQPNQLRRIAFLMAYAESDPIAQRRLTIFRQRLAELGWTEGRNLRIEVRWAGGDVVGLAALVKEVVALNPEVILSNATFLTSAVHQETRTIPTVFVVAPDPVGSGFVKTLSRPGGNMTGLIGFEPSLAEKWLQLLKEIAPRVQRVALMFNPKTAPWFESYLQRFKAAAARMELKPIAAAVSSESDIRQVIAELGRTSRGGLIEINDVFLFTHRKLIIELAARNKVPTIYYNSNHVEDGGLIAYGPDYDDVFRRAAPYVDRILRGAKPEDLPVEMPTKFDLAVNMKTAKTLGLKVPLSFLARASKVID